MNLHPRHETEPKRRTPITRIRRLTWHRAPVESRARLLDDCYDIYREQTRTLDRQEFTRRFFSNPTTRLGLFYGADGRLGGFSNAAVLELTVEGRPHAVFSAGVYVRLAYRGGDASAYFGLTEALRRKARAPHVPLAYMSMACNPATYHLLSTMPRLWPAPGEAPPPHVEEGVRAASAARGLDALADDPWRVRTFVRPEDPERIRRSRSLRDQPTLRFYEARNPGWADPQDATGLLVWIPLDLPNIAGASLRMARRRRH